MRPAGVAPSVPVKVCKAATTPLVEIPRTFPFVFMERPNPLAATYSFPLRPCAGDPTGLAEVWAFEKTTTCLTVWLMPRADSTGNRISVAICWKFFMTAPQWGGFAFSDRFSFPLGNCGCLALAHFARAGSYAAHTMSFYLGSRVQSVLWLTVSAASSPTLDKERQGWGTLIVGLCRRSKARATRRSLALDDTFSIACKKRKFDFFTASCPQFSLAAQSV